MKRSMLILLAVLMLLLAPATQLRANAAETGTCGENLTWTLDDDGTLTISGTGAMDGYDALSTAPWYSLRGNILSVVVEDGVTSIGKYAFNRCENMTDVTISESVTNIDWGAFEICTNLSVVHYTGTSAQKEEISIASLNGEVRAAQWHYGCDGTNCPGLSLTGTCGENLTWVLDDGGILTISGTGAMHDYASVTQVPWYSQRKRIQTVVLEDGVTSIGPSAFESCSKLTGITIPDGVTGIGPSAFDRCSNLTDITIPDSVTSIGDRAFFYCSSLTSISLPDSITSIGDRAFSSCISLTSITIPEGITRIGMYMFSNCSNLSSITIPDSVTNIDTEAFSDCTSLHSITIPDSVISLADGVFSNCTNLSSVIFGNGITTIDSSVFLNCTSLSSITIPEGVTAIHDLTFYDCTILTDIIIPESVTTIGGSAFYNCTALNVVHYGGTEAQRAEITVGSDNSYLKNAQWHYECDGTNCPALPSVVARGTCGENLTWTLDDAGTLTISGTGAMDNYTAEMELPWYSQREAIQSVVVEDGVTNIGDYAFYDYSNLSSVTIGKDVTSIGFRAFQSCESLVSITIPGNVTTIGRAAFNNCSNLSSVTFGDGVTTIGDESFTFCTSLTSITFPDSVTTIDDWAFINCENLSSVTFGKGVTTIGEWAFCECNLDSITIPDSVTTIVGTAFQNCRNLRSVTLGKGITTIEVGTFMNCSSLNDIIIPNTVTTIDDYAFYNCTALSVVHYGGTEAQRAEISIDSNNAVLENAQWHYGCTGTNCPVSDPSTPPKETPFVDVAGDAYYFDPVLWAVENGITNGLDATHFAPDATCTRAQVVTFLWRAKGCPEPKMVYNPFSDVSSDDYYYSAVLWAAETGITTGTSSNTFDPHAECTRGQVATFLWRAQGKPASGGSNSFTDVASGAYYYDAVLWAVENGITNGMGGSIFAPDATCTRGQIVTFLYRAMK